jgi:hypothetical protein
MNAGIQKGLERARRELSANSPGKNCRFMDSLPVTEKPWGDGIHHWRSGQTTRWVDEAKKESLALLSRTPPPDVQAFHGAPKLLDPSNCTTCGESKP